MHVPQLPASRNYSIETKTKTPTNSKIFNKDLYTIGSGWNRVSPLLLFGGFYGAAPPLRLQKQFLCNDKIEHPLCRSKTPSWASKEGIFSGDSICEPELLLWWIMIHLILHADFNVLSTSSPFFPVVFKPDQNPNLWKSSLALFIFLTQKPLHENKTIEAVFGWIACQMNLRGAVIIQWHSPTVP
jgi:hypothetical protein